MQIAAARLPCVAGSQPVKEKHPQRVRRKSVRLDSGYLITALLCRDQEATNILQESIGTNKGNERLRTGMTRCDGNRRRFARLQMLPPSRQGSKNGQVVILAKCPHRQKHCFGGVSAKDAGMFS